MNNKRIPAFLLSATLGASLLTPVWAAESPHFSDIPSSASYADAVETVSQQRIMIGTKAGTFSPDAPVTRGAMVQVLYHMAGSPAADVDGTAWCAQALGWAKSAGLSVGNSDNLYQALTQKEVTELLFQYAAMRHFAAGRTDSSTTEDQLRTAWLKNNHILENPADGKTVTRAELAVLVQSVLAMQEPMKMADYLSAHADSWFQTGKTSYVIQGKMVSQKTAVHNVLEDVDYTVEDDNTSVILKGVYGEEWVTSVAKVLKTYTKEDGTPLTESDFTGRKDTFVKIKTVAAPNENFACYIPAGVAVEVATAWGDTLYANRTGVPHGNGDYLVCRNVDGKPDLSDVWVVNGAVFGQTYDTANAPQFGAVKEIEKYGHTLLDLTIADFEKAGFELGDTVDVTFDNGYTLTDIPFFDGYYVAKGEPMLRAYPGHTNIAVCINYGKLYEVANVGLGSVAAISLHTKGGAKAEQELNSLVYTNQRSDYASDEVFANFRPVTAGKIAEGALYRSASPISNEYGRASYANALAQKHGVAAVLNLADTPEDIQGYLKADGFDSAYYQSLFEQGNVIALGMPVDYSSDSFGDKLAGGLAQLSEKKGPYLVHCTEGKDRAGFASALLECLMGATLEEVVSDYMVSYENYYGVTQASDPEKFQLIVNNNIYGMLRTIAGVSSNADLAKADLQAGAVQYLTSHGMTQAQISALQTNLSTAQ